MNFYAIGPLATKELITDHPYHMALAQYLYDYDYLTFMCDQLSKGHKVILDSGVYEDSAVDNRQLFYWVSKLHPTAVILPDKPHDCRETLKSSLKFAQMMDDANLPTLKYKVLHASKLDDFVQSYIYDSRLFYGVCFSRLTQDYDSENSIAIMSRPSFITYLKDNDFWNPSAYHHALGMKDGSLEELRELSKLGVNSCDSSAPIWRGLHDSPLSGSSWAFHTPFDPFSTLPLKSTAVANMQKVNEICPVSK